MPHNPLKPGTQIAYIPQHVRVDYSSLPARFLPPETEYGFVVEPRENGAFCRFFRKHSAELRTVANSEFAPWEDLEEFTYLPQGTVDMLLKGCQL